MKRIERIILDEKEQEIVMDFIHLIDEIDRCLEKEYFLQEKLSNFLDTFDEFVEEW